VPFRTRWARSVGIDRPLSEPNTAKRARTDRIALAFFAGRWVFIAAIAVAAILEALRRL
jgi:hypothetical protein